MAIRYNTVSFIEKSKELYPNQFDYEDCQFVNQKTNVHLRCIKHSPPENVVVKPDHHLRRGSGCKVCKADKARAHWQLGLDGFMERVNSIAPDKFGFDNAKYVNAHTPVELLCLAHNELFFVIPDVMQRVQSLGCKQCTHEKRIAAGKRKTVAASSYSSINKFELKLHEKFGDKIRLIRETYKTRNTEASFTCEEHGLFTGKPSKILEKKAACIECGKPVFSKKQFNETEFIELCYQALNPSYSLVSIEINKTEPKKSRLTIRCTQHPMFTKEIAYLRCQNVALNCPECYPKDSTSVTHWMEKLQARLPSHLPLHLDDIDIDSGRATIHCDNHGAFTRTFQSLTKKEEIECGLCQREESFLIKLHELYGGNIKLLNERPFLTTTQPTLSDKEGTFKCIKHGQMFNLMLDRSKEWCGCIECRKEDRADLNAEKSKKKQEQRIKGFFEKAKQVHKRGHYSYPYIEKELVLLSSNITVICHIHDYEFPCNAGEHISTNRRSGKGRGCPKCKEATLRELHRKPFNVLKEELKKKGFELLTSEHDYISASHQVAVKCQFGHETKRVAQKLLSGHPCSSCSGSLGEEITRVVFEKHFGFALEKVRLQPSSGRYNRLELDGYNEDHKLAFEYQGAPHVHKKFHGNDKEAEAKFEEQLERDEATRMMCNEKGITLIEVMLFDNPFRLENIFEQMNSGLVRAGFTAMTSWSDDFNPITEVYFNRPESKQLAQICKEHNLSVMDEVIGKSSFQYLFQCNACGFEFKNSIYQRETAKHKCCPQCARKRGAKKAKKTNTKKHTEYLNNLREKCASFEFELMETQWHGVNTYQYELKCIHTQKTFYLTYNNLQKKVFKCRCDKHLELKKGGG